MAKLQVQHICRYPGCFQSTYNKYCDLHPKRPKRSGKKRPSAAKRGYDRNWQRARAFFLRKNPLCAECMRNKKHIPAIVVDHIEPHKGDIGLFWDQGNWQSLCVSCHAAKTAKEDGGFGNPMKGR